MNPVSFDWKSDDRGHDIGVIAQEVLEVIPEIVAKHDLIGDKKYEFEKEYPGEHPSRYTVNYEKLSVILINSIQEQQLQINDLKQRVEELENGSSK